jgi:tRNA(Met) C34 N-acetyltransferase TmcA
MSKNRNPLIPTDYTDEQLEAIRRIPRIIQLKRERLVIATAERGR